MRIRDLVQLTWNGGFDFSLEHILACDSVTPKMLLTLKVVKSDANLIFLDTKVESKFLKHSLGLSLKCLVKRVNIVKWHHCARNS